MYDILRSKLTAELSNVTFLGRGIIAELRALITKSTHRETLEHVQDIISNAKKKREEWFAQYLKRVMRLVQKEETKMREGSARQERTTSSKKAEALLSDL